MNRDMEFIQKILSCDDVVASINQNLDDIIKIIPEIFPMIGFEHKHPHHHLDVWQHTLYALSLSSNDFDVRLALLMHDIGKPSSCQESEGIRHFAGHPQVSAQIAQSVLTRLGYKKSFVEYICKIISLHDTPLTEQDIANNPSLSKKIFEVQKCDALAHNPLYNKKRLEYIAKTTKFFEKDNNLQN